MIIVLVTGIKPFESGPTNPLWDTVQALDSTQVDGAVIMAWQLPCVSGLVNEILVDTIEATSPVLVFVLGLTMSRTEISMKRVATNVTDARISDGAGNQLVDTPVVADGPMTCFSILPIRAIVHTPHEIGIPAGVSWSAGTYNCNYLSYDLMHHIAIRMPQVHGGFIHMPITPKLAARHTGRSSLSIDIQIKGIRLAVCTTLATQSNSKISTDVVH